MSSLDHKVPPLLITLLCAALAWLLARSTPDLVFAWPAWRFPVAAAFGVAGPALALWGVIAFRRARTTVNPTAPQHASAIVQAGPYRYTRNPMYLGMASTLLGLCAYLSNPLTLVAPLVFGAYITRFQILPEERALLEHFGAPYADYLRAVRRWL